MNLSLRHIADHPLTAQLDQPAWAAFDWHDLARVGTGTATYATRFKAAYSEQGLYCLFDCEDRRLTCSGLPDNGNLFTEDVIEVFLWPDEQHPLYFEYEISPLGAQLPILVSNRDGAFHGWLPWNHEGARRCQAKTAARGGPLTPGATVTGWSADFFIPFALLKGGVSAADGRPALAGKFLSYRLRCRSRLPLGMGSPDGTQFSRLPQFRNHDL